MKSKIIAIAAAIFILSPANLLALGNSCIHSSEHESLTYLLVDRSDKLANKEGFDQSMSAALEIIAPGERLIVGVSVGKGSDARILLDLVKMKGSAWTSPIKVRAENKRFAECFKKVTAELTAIEESHETSAIMETLGFVSKVLAADSSNTKRLIMYSDMMQNSAALSFYKEKSFQPELLMKAVERELLLPKLQGVSVKISGVGAGVTDKRVRELEAFWTLFFERAGAQLKYFGPVLLQEG